MSKDLNDKLENIKQSLGKSEKKVVEEKIPNSHSKEIGIDRRKFNKRDPKSGRKPKKETLIKRGIKLWVDQHINEEVDITVVDKKTGKTITIKKQRIMYILEKLYSKATKNDGDTAAIGLWLDRALGKAPQPIKGDENDTTPIRLQIDIQKLAEKSLYGTGE